ncbi:MAG: carboxypeptidase regulatory-like domain-containing protein [Bacteroidetes bacterium]|nr:carboxypeptidase regulatory-like domain-containing protein [Bacteroidota bacterium]
MKKYQFVIFFLVIVVTSLQGFCAILHVPATYSSIQEGIDASADGDIVLVEPGVYYENLSLNGKNIILCSKYFTTGNSAFIANTIIDGNNTGRVITIDQWENSSCQVVGFTIQHGNSTIPWTPGETDGGGGIFILDASPQILHCIIQNNYASGYGGGLSLYGSNSSAKVMNCTIQNNTADSFGGGVFMGDCTADAEIVNCVISGNTITCSCDWNGSGGGVNLYHTGKLTNCLVTGNSAPNSPVGGGGIHCDWGDLIYGSQAIFITGCTIVNNTALNNGGVSYVVTGGEFRNCIIWGNTDYFGNIANYDGNTFVNCCTDPLPDGSGNISSDPYFVDSASGNFRLLSGSPCIDAGWDAFNNQPVDLDGNPRIFGSTIDMGAYEYGSGTGVNVQIGNGSDISDFFPIYSCYGYNYSQQIYLGSEITDGGGAAGMISKVRFYYSGNGSEFSNWNTWTVYLGNTTKTDFTSISDWVPVADMAQVFSGAFPVPVAGTWIEITLSNPFYYSGNNIVVAVHENAPGYDCTAEWASFNAGAPRGLLYYDDNNNPDPASPPDANVDPDWNIAQVQFLINPAFGTLAGYIYEEPACTVPVEGAKIIAGTDSTTSDAAGYYQVILPVGTYNATAFYHDANQTFYSLDVTEGNTATQDFCLTPYYAPPVSLHASISGPGMNNVHLSWKAPGSIADQYIHWDNGTIAGGLGYNGPATFSVASRWPVADIAPYNGTYLKKIRFEITEPTASYTLKVWKGANASTLLLSQPVIDPIINNWNEVTLTTPVFIDGTEEFWFGYEVIQTTGYPAGLGPGPAVVGKGDMVYSGYDWISIKLAWGFDFNWTLQGFVSEDPALAMHQLIPMVQNTSQQPILNNQMQALIKPQIILVDQTTASKSSHNLPMTDDLASKTPIMVPLAPSATLTGYNVYRDNAKIGDNIPDLFYDDLALPKGGYDYEISAQYEFGESAKIGPLHVDIYTCFPPTSLTVSNSTLTTTTASLSWMPSTISTNLEWTLEWGPAGFSLGNGTTVHISSTPGYSFQSLAPGTEYDVYVNTYCSPTDASEWVRKTFRARYFNCPVNAIAEIETCGAATNNGCEQAIPGWENINCGDTICGTSWLSRSHRDPDWYSFTLAAPSDVTLSGDAEFSKTFGIATSPCDSSLINTSTGSNAGYFIQFTTQLFAAGTYYLNVVPAFAEQVACDSLSRYWFTIKCNPCMTPTALNDANVSSTSADLMWTSNAALWNIEWGPFGFTQGTGTMIAGTSSNPYHLSGLTMGHSYSFYVQSNCGGGSTSDWAGPYTFFLPCPATMLPYTEDFTSQVIGTTPQCWQVKNYGAPSNWIVELSSYAGGTFPELVFQPYNPYFFGGRSFMTSPVINTSGMASLNLSFKQYINAYSPVSSCEIWTTSNGGTSWSSVWSLSQTGVVGPETKSLAITTPDVGSANFQFAFVVNGNSWDIHTWQIDDISLTGTPQTGTLQGVVTVCSNSNTLDGVTVTAGTNTTTTNTSGFYQFSNIPVGTYDVEFSLTGYDTKSVLGIQALNGLTTILDTCLNLTGPPAIRTVQNETIINGQTACFDATQTIIVAGSGTTFIVESGGVANMIAGINIDYLPGAWVRQGGYMHGKIALNGPFCGVKAASFVSANAEVEENRIVVEKPNFRIYPNPTNGKFRMELTGMLQTEKILVEIYGMRGEKVLAETLSGEVVHDFSLSDRPTGIYFIKVISGVKILTSKLVKTR